MNNFDYKLVRRYDTQAEFSSVNYLCKDNYVHVRLRRYGDKQMHISGFEAKLTFLLTFLINKVANDILSISMIKMSEDREKYQVIWNSCLDCLKTTKEYKDIECVLSTVMRNYKGIKILPMYSLKHGAKNAFDLLGECVDSPFSKMTDVFDCGDIYGFGDIVDFLFNNNVEVYIENKTIIDDSKFIRKYAEKEDEVESLW